MQRVIYGVVGVMLLSTLLGSAADRTYGSRSVARSRGTVTKECSVGGHTRAVSSKNAVSPTEARPIKRNSAARGEFQKQHPCPATGMTTGACTGYVVDHVVPLKRGGADKATNMQWQTTADAKAKDRIE